MSKQALLVLLVLFGLVALAGCGDDLGWGKVSEATDADCATADHDTPPAQDIPESVTQSDADSSGDSELVDSLGDGDGDDNDADGSQLDVEVEAEVADAITATDATEDVADSDPDVGPPPECTETTDCATVLCVVTTCEGGKCVYDKALLDNIPCDTDGSVCTIEKCLNGKCLSAGVPFCDDSNPCTDDLCDSVKGCEHWPNMGGCDDGSACTVGDACVSAVCLPGTASPDCDDKDICTDDTCDPTKGCLHPNNTAPCDDAVGCTEGDACKDGICLSGDPTSCDDNNPCTDDACDVLSDCQNLPNADTCTDGNSCTEGDSCGQGACSGAAKNCDDANSCTDDSCDPALGCLHLSNVIPCNDGNACTVGDACEGGTCIGGNALSCNDGNDCSLDVCDIAKGCTVTDAPDGTPCADGYCLAGLCGCKAFGCAAPKFTYNGDVNAGMIGGMGGNIGPKMGCAPTDVLIGIGFDFSTNVKTATRTTVVCGKVEADQNGTVKTTQTTTQKSGGSGCYGWDPAPSTPLAMCPSGWVIVGISGKNAGDTLFHSVSVTCAKMDVGGKPTDIVQTTPIPATNAGGGTPKSVMCPAGTVARYFETRAGCGQDALTLYCAKSSPDCTGQPPICTE